MLEAKERERNRALSLCARSLALFFFSLLSPNFLSFSSLLPPPQREGPGPEQQVPGSEPHAQHGGGLGAELGDLGQAGDGSRGGGGGRGGARGSAPSGGARRRRRRRRTAVPQPQRVVRAPAREDVPSAAAARTRSPPRPCRTTTRGTTRLPCAPARAPSLARRAAAARSQTPTPPSSSPAASARPSLENTSAVSGAWPLTSTLALAPSRTSQSLTVPSSEPVAR